MLFPRCICLCAVLSLLAAASPGARAASVNTFVLGNHVLIPETPPCPSEGVPPLENVTPIPIRLVDADGLQGVQLRLDYNPTVLEFVDPAGTCLQLTEGRGSLFSAAGSSAIVKYNNFFPGQASQVWLSVAQIDSVSGSGTVVTLYARARPGVPPGTASPLTLASGPYAIVLASEEGNQAPRTVINGSVTVGSAGDVDGDRVVDTGDAVRTLKFAVLLSQPTPDELRAADMNQDRRVEVDDTVMVLRKAIGLTP